MSKKCEEEENVPKQAYLELMDRFRTVFIPKILSGNTKVYTLEDHTEYYQRVIHPVFLVTKWVTLVNDRSDSNRKYYKCVDLYGEISITFKTFFTHPLTTRNYIDMYKKYMNLVRLLKVTCRYLDEPTILSIARDNFILYMKSSNLADILINQIIENGVVKHLISEDDFIFKYIYEEQEILSIFFAKSVEYFNNQLIADPTRFYEKLVSVPMLFDNYIRENLKFEYADQILDKMIGNLSRDILDFLKTRVKTIIELREAEEFERLFKAILHRDEYKQEFSKYVTQLIDDLNHIKENPTTTEYIEYIIETVTKYLFISKTNHTYAQAVANHARKLVNTDTFIGDFNLYIDNVMKTSENYQLVEILGQIFTYILDKDIFYDGYVMLLSKRLLDLKYASIDMELTFLKCLKYTAGASYTSKAEAMIVDHKNVTQHSNDFSCLVLKSSVWPAFIQINPILPTELQLKLDGFIQQFRSAPDNASKVLKPIYSVGTCLLSAVFPSGRFDFQVATLQAIVLLAFNDKPDPLSFDEIKALTGIHDVECLKKILHSLSCHKHILLNKIPESKKVEITDKFVKNVKYTSKLKKVSLSLPSLESAKKPEVVQAERGFQIEAAIVRIMKSRQVLKHFNLEMEVVKYFQNSFAPQPRLIKKKIEDLIDREYLQRDEKEMDKYTYLA